MFSYGFFLLVFCCEFVMLVEICDVIFLQKMYLGKCLCCGYGFFYCGCGLLEVKNDVCVMGMDFFFCRIGIFYFSIVFVL